eukprot:146182-Chlamydomonas_euryale.AAC.1
MHALSQPVLGAEAHTVSLAEGMVCRDDARGEGSTWRAMRKKEGSCASAGARCGAWLSSQACALLPPPNPQPGTGPIVHPHSHFWA